MSKKLKGQVAIVTGSSSGIGQAVAVKLAEEGAKVVVTYHSSEEGAKETKKKIKKVSDSEVLLIKTDVSKENDVKKLFEATLNKWGHLDILVSNAGIQKDSSFVDMSLKDWKAVIDTNLTGAFLSAREAARIFMKQGITKRSCAAGKILFMSSVHEIIRMINCDGKEIELSIKEMLKVLLV